MAGAAGSLPSAGPEGLVLIVRGLAEAGMMCAGGKKVTTETVCGGYHGVSFYCQLTAR